MASRSNSSSSSQLSDFFDGILSLIPAKVYFGQADDDRAEPLPNKYTKVRFPLASEMVYVQEQNNE